MPMDETLAVVAVDLGGRPALVYKDLVKTRLVGDLQSELLEDFFGGFVNARRREPPCQGAGRAVEPPQGRSDLQVLRPRHAVRLFEGRAAEEPVAVHQGPAMIAIFDYGAGNLRSVENTLAEIGAAYTLMRDAAGLRRAGEDHSPRAWATSAR